MKNLIDDWGKKGLVLKGYRGKKRGVFGFGRDNMDIEEG